VLSTVKIHGKLTIFAICRDISSILHLPPLSAVILKPRLQSWFH